ncbi:hypothetical protein N7532_000234, partial [Penicillium argentinense]
MPVHVPDYSRDSREEYFRNNRKRPKYLETLIVIEELLICLINAIVFAAFAQGTGVFSRRVHEFPELFKPPYSPYIGRGTDMPFITACIVIAWTVLLFLPQICWLASKRSWWLIVTLFRCGVVVCLALSAVFQSWYLPLPLGSCQNDGEWRDTTNVPEGTLTMFKDMPTEIIDHNGGIKTVSACERLLWIWRFEIAN